MAKSKHSSMIWLLSLTTLIAFAVWAGLLLYRVRQQQDAIAAFQDLKQAAHERALLRSPKMSPLAGFRYPFEVQSFDDSSVVVVEYEPHGSKWLRQKIGDERCQKWIDFTTAIDLSRSSAEDADVARLWSFTALKKLDLSGTKVTDQGLIVLRQMTSLEAQRAL